MAVSTIKPDGASHWSYCQTVRLIGNRRYQATAIDEMNGDYSNNPYSIMIYGFLTLYFVSSTYRGYPLQYINEILKGDVTLTLTDGVLQTGNDGNRQFVAFCPNGITLTEVT